MCCFDYKEEVILNVFSNNIIDRQNFLTLEFGYSMKK